MSDEALPEHVLRNRTVWDRFASDYEAPGRANWGASDPTWGIFSVPESDLLMLPEDMTGMNAVELGCGTAYVSAWMARRGANPMGIDNSPNQLANARKFQSEFGIEFPLHLGNAEETPFPDDTFDFAISEYGAAIWCDPYKWIPEAARILRPGGRLVFLGNGVLLMLCTATNADSDTPVTERLERPLFGMHRFDWEDDGSVEFHLPHGKMIALLRDAGFEIEELLEVQVPAGATTTYPFVTLNWAQQWPCEEIWKVRKSR